MTKKAKAKTKDQPKVAISQPKVAISQPKVAISDPAGLMPAVQESLADSEPRHISNSVVESKFKQRYTTHARETGVKGKAARRSNWDWLSQRIAERCLDNKYKIDIDKFLDILSLNGIDHSRWNNRSRGWEGRLRMTGRVALQRVVADTGKLKLGKREVVIPPADFVAKYKTKDYTE